MLFSDPSLRSAVPTRNNDPAAGAGGNNEQRNPLEFGFYSEMTVMEKTESPDKLERRHRRSIRLRGYDYSCPGAYFITICTRDRECLFGHVADGEMVLSDAGKIASGRWWGIPKRFEHVQLDEFVVMPNHVHGIVILNGKPSADFRRGLINQTPTDPDPKWILMRNRKTTLGKIIRHYKAGTARTIRNHGRDEFGWQRNYFERIIRDEAEMYRIRDYIATNPAGWAEDENNPAHALQAAHGAH
jgi:putative transposase